MTLPEMILFDYGGTLLYEPDFDPMAMEKAAFEHLTANPKNLTVEQIYAHVRSVFEKATQMRMADAEFHQHHFMRLAYETLGLEFDIPYAQLEELQWYAASPGDIMPDADKMLDYLNLWNIRTGVISNIGWSGRALRRRLDRLLPGNRFEFVIASSEYGIRKPDRLIFELALQKAGLPPEKVWFCGDNKYADILGASAAGIYPVHYRGTAPKEVRRSLMWEKDTDIPCDYLELDEWRHLPMVLNDLREKQNDMQND